MDVPTLSGSSAYVIGLHIAFADNILRINCIRIKTLGPQSISYFGRIKYVILRQEWNLALALFEVPCLIVEGRSAHSNALESHVGGSISSW
jgi:hypothetical protein